MSPTTNFQKTLEQLEEFVAEPISNNRDRAGIIQAFEFTFEQAWKSIQKMAGEQGVQIGNPRSAFQHALSNQWIQSEDETQWLEMIKDRNLTSHTYNQDKAEEVIKKIKSHYVGLFCSLLGRLLTV